MQTGVRRSPEFSSVRTVCVATALRDELPRASGCLGAQPVLTQRYLRTGDREGAAGGPQPSCCPPRSTRSCTCSGWRSQTRPPSRLHRWFRGGTRTRSSALGSSLACAGQRDQALHCNSQGKSRTGAVERVCSSSTAPHEVPTA